MDFSSWRTLESTEEGNALDILAAISVLLSTRSAEKQLLHAMSGLQADRLHWARHSPESMTTSSRPGMWLELPDLLQPTHPIFLSRKSGQSCCNPQDGRSKEWLRPGVTAVLLSRDYRCLAFHWSNIHFHIPQSQLAVELVEKESKARR